MFYTEFLSIVAMLCASMGNVFTSFDGVVIFTTVMDYDFTLLDMLLSALISEELMSLVMEL